MIAFDGPAPSLAAEEEARGDRQVARIIERLDQGRDIGGLQQFCVRDTFETAARYTEQPEDRP